MFIFSIKTTKRRLAMVAVVVVAVVVVAALAVTLPKSSATVAPKKSVPGSSNEERIAFLTSLNYTVDDVEPEHKRILIPEEFDDVFVTYEKIQKECGMSFELYKGKTVEGWAYRVTNIPNEGEVFAHIFTYNGVIVGGDISSTAIDGFMTALIKNPHVADVAESKSTTSGNVTTASGNVTSAVTPEATASGGNTEANATTVAVAPSVSQ